MRWFYKLPLRLRSVVRKGRVERELSDELRFHVEKLIEEKLAKGMTAEEARYAALRELGGVEQIKEECRDMRRVNYVESLLQDLRYGLRMRAKNPSFTAVAVLTLALGIGANTAIFSVVNAVLLSPLPYSNPDRLMLVKEVLTKVGPQPVTVSAPDIAQIRKLNHVFENIGGYRGWGVDLSTKDEPERVFANRASSSLFPLLGVQPLIGRNFSEQEDRPGQNVVILSYGLWQRRFGGNGDVIGKTVTLDRKLYTIVGVMSKDFVFPLPGMSGGGAADLWVPLALTPEELSDVGDSFNFGVLGRLKPGIGLTEANADLAIVAQGVLETWREALPKEDLSHFQLGVIAQPLGDQVLGPVKPMLGMLLGAVAFVLLIACTNIANLLLVRAAGRQKEIAVRLALGAGPFSLLRQLLVEGMLLSISGATLGLALNYWIKSALAAGLPSHVPQFRPIEVEPRVLLFTLALALITGLVFGVLPALSVSGTDVSGSLKEAGRGSSQGVEYHRLRSTLVVVEVALSMMLLAGAGLLLRSFRRVLDTKPGFEPEHVLTAQINLPVSQYKQPGMIYSFHRQLLERLRQNPGVKAVGISTDVPLQGGWTHLFTPEGYQLPPGASMNLCYHSVTSSDYLQAMGIPLLRGRYFNDNDRANSTHVLIVSQALAKHYWPKQDPIGKRLKWGPPQSTDPWLTVVGVVGDVKQGPLEVATARHTYEPYVQVGGAIQNFVVALRAEGDPARMANGLRAAVWGLDRQLAVAQIRTMDEVISRSTAARRFNLFLLGSFAVLALLLAAIGVYGVLAYSVTRRTHEIGVRMALGARPNDVVRLVLIQGTHVVGIGILLGVLGAFSLARFLSSLLYGVRPTDPLTFLAVSLILTAVALAASYIPARRATKVDPMVALRYE